jgi:thiol-disulfide isomerase/thioredoxin
VHLSWLQRIGLLREHSLRPQHLPPFELILSFAILATFLCAGLARAHGDSEGWEQTAGVQLMVGDSLDAGGSVFDAPDYQHTLVIPTMGERAYLLALKTQTVSMIPLTAIEWDAEQRPIPDVDAAEELGLLVSEDGVMLFDGETRSYRVQPEPPLIGDISYEKLRAAKPDYVFAAKSYTPDPKAIAALSKVATDTRIELFFGSWCSHCQHWVPKLMRVVEEAKNPRITVNVHAMSEDQSQPEDSIRAYGVSKTPTFVVVQGGDELGRIEEEPLLSVEADLVKILNAK